MAGVSVDYLFPAVYAVTDNADATFKEIGNNGKCNIRLNTQEAGAICDRVEILNLLVASKMTCSSQKPDKCEWVFSSKGSCYAL